MGKVVKAIGVIAAIAVNVIPGVGQAVSAALLGALASAGVYVSVGTAIGLATAGILAGTSMIAGKGAAGRLAATGITGQVGLNPDTPQWIAVGETATPSALLYWGTSGTDNKFLSQIIAHSFHPINAFIGMKINTATEVLTGNSTVYPGNATDTTTPVLSIQNTAGRQTANPFTTVRGNEWGAAHIGRGIAMTHFRFAYDQEKLATGLPQNIQAIVEGVRVYDPRRDSTRGGTGTMRADDEGTWAYLVGSDVIGRNPALIELSYRIGFRQNGRLKAGMGEDLFNLDFASYIAAANICDEVVAGAPRYRCDGILAIGPGEVHNVNLAKIHSSCGGKPIDAGGLIGFWAAHDDTAVSVMDFTDDDFVGAIDWDPAPDGGRRNTSRGSYISPALNYAAEPYLEVAPSDLRALDNGQELAEPIDFPMITNQAQSRRLASIRLRESRQGVLIAPFRLKALGVRPQQIVTITHPRFGWSAKKFRVEEQGLAIDQIRLVLRAVAAADYADVSTTPSAAVTAPATSGFYPIVPVRGSAIGVENGADVTANNQSLLQIPNDQIIQANSGGFVLAGQLPRPLKASFFLGGADVSSSTTWSLDVAAAVATISTTGQISLLAQPASGRIKVTGVRTGVTLTGTFLVATNVAAAPGTPSGGGTAQTFSSFTSTDSTSFVQVGAEQTVLTGSVGTLTATGSLGFSAVLSDNQFARAELKWQYRTPAGSGTWTDFGTGIRESDAAFGGVFGDPEQEPQPSYPGTISANQASTGPAASTSYGVRLVARSLDARTIQMFGSATVAGS